MTFPIQLTTAGTLAADYYVAARLRHRLRADFEAKRQLLRENLQLRQGLARLQRRLRQRVRD